MTLDNQIAKPNFLAGFGQTLLDLVRILVGAYFLAQAAAIILSPPYYTLFDDLMSSQNAQRFTIVFLSLSATFLIADYCVRPVALLLGGYTMAMAALGAGFVFTADTLADHSGQLATIGVLLIVAAASSCKGREYSDETNIKAVSQPEMPRTALSA